MNNNNSDEVKEIILKNNSEENNMSNENNINLDKNNNELKIIKLSDSNNNNLNENNNELKIIKFSDSKNNNSDENIESIIFNNNSESNMNNSNFAKFISDNKMVTMEEEITINNMDLIYKDDIVYLKELENQLLSELPITKQSLKFIQIHVRAVTKSPIHV